MHRFTADKPGHTLRECPHCALLQRVPDMKAGGAAICPRCGAVLRRQRTDPFRRPLAFAVTGLFMFAVAARMTFLVFDLSGRVNETTLESGPLELQAQGMWELAIVVFITTMFAPLAKLISLVWVLGCLQLRRAPRHLHAVFRWVELLSPWAMVEVFLLGVFVAYTKLIDLAHVEVGVAVYTLGALMLATAAADATLDHMAVWEALQRRGLTARPMNAADAPQLPVPGVRLLGCECCGLVTPAAPRCPRCGSRLHARKPDSLNRTVALLVAAMILYIPANLLPVMTIISFGSGSPSTILGGVVELADAGMWPLAILVFFASITVPVLKLIGLWLLVITTRNASSWRLRERTRIYRIVEGVGRWSMIDVFMISILTAIVRLGTLATIRPGPGVTSFCGVVIVTMFAAMIFDPRLMWDAAERRQEQRGPATMRTAQAAAR
nr:paraquat-inducible protein A [Limobrevibacterium gyesilva]